MTTELNSIEKEDDGAVLINLEEGKYIFSDAITIGEDGEIKLKGFTAGSVLFAGASGKITQDNFNLFWDAARGELQPNLMKITSDGSQASPALKFNDTNTGFYKSGDSVRLSLNNSTKTTVDATGLGIGTVSPAEKLDVAGNIVISQTTATVYNNASNGWIKLSAGDKGTAVPRITIFGASHASVPSRISFVTGGSSDQGEFVWAVDTGTEQELMRLESNGNLGIGTPNPFQPITIVKNPTDTNQPTGIHGTATDDHTALFISGSGNVVDEKLGIQFGLFDSGANKWGIGGIYGVLDSDTGKTTGDLTFDMRSVTGDTLLTEVMRITHEGNVGIGTTSPTLPLDVKAKSGHTAIGGIAIKLTNKTGSNTVAGQLISPYSATAVDDAFKTALTNSDEVIGIVLDAGVADGSEAWVVISGIADVLMDGGGSARGDRIISSVTAGSADVWNVGGAVATHFQEIGHCIETRVGTGTARCILHFN